MPILGQSQYFFRLLMNEYNILSTFSMEILQTNSKGLLMRLLLSEINGQCAFYTNCADCRDLVNCRVEYICNVIFRFFAERLVSINQSINPSNCIVIAQKSQIKVFLSGQYLKHCPHIPSWKINMIAHDKSSLMESIPAWLSEGRVHACILFDQLAKPHLHVFWQWEEARVTGENSHVKHVDILCFYTAFLRWLFNQL